MALDKRVVGINFTQGLDTRSDSKLVIPGKLTTLQNATLSKDNSVTPRPRWTNLRTGSNTVNTLATFNSELLSVRNGALSSELTSGTALSKGTVSPFTLAKTEILRSGGLQDQHDVATGGSLTCYVWRDCDATGLTLGVNVLVKDETTGATVLANTALRTSNTAFCPRVVATANAFIVFYVDAPTLYARVIQFSAPTVVGTESPLKGDVTNATGIDACVFGSNALCAYPCTTAPNTTFALIVTQSAGTPSVSASGGVTGVAAGTIAGIACAQFSSSAAGIYVLSQTGGGLWAAVINASAAVTAGPTNKDAGAATGTGLGHVTAALNGSTMYVYSDDYARRGEGGHLTRNVRSIQLDATNTTVSGPSTFILSTTPAASANTMSGPFIGGKAFVANGTTYLPMTIEVFTSTGLGGYQNSWFILDSSAKVVARALYGSRGLPSSTGVSSSAAVTASQFIFALGERTLLSFANGANVSQTGICRVGVTFGGTGQARAQLGQNALFAGGLLGAYDGNAAVEAGFLLFPETVSVADGAAGSVDAGVHQYVAVYEWVDGAGQRHQSAPSVAVSYTAPGAKQATVTIPTLLLTNKTGVNILVFRTVAGGSTFYRLNAANSPLANSTSAAVVTYTDNTTDANLISGEVLYTLGGTLPNNMPGPCSAMCIHQQRVFVNSGEDPFQFFYSQPTVANFGLQWSELLTGRVTPQGGGIVGFASMDDKLVILKQRGISVVYGTGPNATGGSNNYSTPVDLPTDIGCVDARSILLMPMGVVFKALKGWHVLGRDLSVRYIGEGVEAFNGNDVTSAVLLDDRKEARFSSTSGTLLVWSYLTDQWSVFLNHRANDAVWWPALAAYVFAVTTTGGFSNVLAQSDVSSVVWDANNGIPAVVLETGWLKPSEALAGFQRVWRFLLTGTAPSSGDSSIQIQAAYDYSPTYTQSASFSSVVALSGAGAPYTLRWHMPVQKCQAIRFKITETPSGVPPATWAGSAITGMSLELGAKKGVYKLPAAQSA